MGTQAFENVVSGERYKNVTDESIKYALGYYGETAFPIDPDVLDRIMGLPRTQAFLDWKPEGLFKSIEELRQELGPELSDDDLLLKVLIPGRPVKTTEPTKQVGAAAASAAASAPRAGASPAGASPAGAPVAAPAATLAAAAPDLAAFRGEFSVDVDGEVFTVRISPVGNHGGGGVTAEDADAPGKPREIPEGAVLCAAPGLILSIEVEGGRCRRRGR